MSPPPPLFVCLSACGRALHTCAAEAVWHAVQNGDLLAAIRASRTGFAVPLLQLLGTDGACRRLRVPWRLTEQCTKLSSSMPWCTNVPLLSFFPLGVRRYHCLRIDVYQSHDCCVRVNKCQFPSPCFLFYPPDQMQCWVLHVGQPCAGCMSRPGLMEAAWCLLLTCLAS